MTPFGHYQNVDTARQLVSVASVLGLLLLVLYLLRRYRGNGALFQFRAARGSLVRVVERIALTPQHSLHVVTIGDETVILAAGPGGVRVVRKVRPAQAVLRRAGPGGQP